MYRDQSSRQQWFVATPASQTIIQHLFFIQHLNNLPSGRNVNAGTSASFSRYAQFYAIP